MIALSERSLVGISGPCVNCSRITLPRSDYMPSICLLAVTFAKVPAGRRHTQQFTLLPRDILDSNASGVGVNEIGLLAATTLMALTDTCSLHR